MEKGEAMVQMQGRMTTVVVAAGLLWGAGRTAVAGGPPAEQLKKCPVDAVVSGTVCMDKYEASVWRIPATNPSTGRPNTGVITKVRNGKAKVADLSAGGATQLGTAGDDYAPALD
jgi:hypothetical protein